jgi:hypothetical protein
VWLLALGVQVRFTRKRCPTDHANTLRTHQTMTAQALLGQTYPSHAADVGQDWMNADRSSTTTCSVALSTAKRRKRAYPHAIHSGRSYRPEWEEELLSLEKVCNYLAQGRWFRGVRSNGYFGGGRYQYYLGKHFARCGVAIRFDPDTTTLMCQLEGSEESIGLPAQGITRAELMGELALLQALPIYQLALPFSLAAWRQLEYALNLTGTTL